jgi:phosphatidate cytidylyltransferase
VTEKNRNLVTRLLSAFGLLPVILYLLSLGGYWTGFLLAAAAGICTYEYLTITIKDVSPIGWFTVLLASLMPLLPVVFPVEATALFCAAIGVVLFGGWMWHLLNGPLPEAPVRTAHLLTGFIYGSGGLIALAAIRQMPDGGWWMLAALVITWANDSAAYFAGRFFGRRKLYPEVSPNKTWEGFLGGMAGSIGFLFLQRALFFPVLSISDCIILGFLGGLLGPAGDLCESMLKRAYGVKDSGGIIPGHGGILDRIDALIFNAPMLMLYVQFVRGAVNAA